MLGKFRNTYGISAGNSDCTLCKTVWQRCRWTELGGGAFETAGEFGPIVLSDFHLIDKLAHFDRERIPERVVHAKGHGAHGYFKVTHDVTKYTKAKMFETIGK